MLRTTPGLPGPAPSRKPPRFASSPLLAAALALATALPLASCSPPVTIPDAERQRAARELEGASLFLKVAVYAAPLFDDEDKLFLSDQPLDELDLLRTPGGELIAPPPAERVLLPGTPVEVKKVEFPTGWTIAARVLRTPRYHPWVYLAVRGEPRPVVVVLPQLVASAEEARAELERIAGARDLGPLLRSLPEAQRAAVAKKELVAGMSAAAAELAWGYPERKVLDRPSGAEAWTWPGGRRRAWFAGGRLTRFEHDPAPAG